MTPHDLVASSDYGHPMAAWLEPALADQRVLLRPPAPGDEPALVGMAIDERVRHYLGGPVDAQTAAANAAQKIAASWGQFVIVDRGSGEVAGSGSLARKRGPWEISYQLRHQFWGRQLASSSVVLIRDWFFAHMPDDVLIGTTQLANERSRRVLHRAGAVLTGAFTQYGERQERYDFLRGATR